ncbi:MAG TPA: AtpZ/AtpI family protein [Saprospiraceae bacterium]|nr:AtpZ/AtpI family protein [Candidatus Parvibacillus calidus]MBX2935922.1 AtpZ/AtpI family protein [Saprospiraceae bacterium]MBX7180278.1 AtpZ/AtpI family protein [Saprospiraceae bacterium]MCB0592129.1 AtpZ/AtpI family protein [Saprospiraceae bacterium]MCC7148294.1 AtpZ/AtpI family protein [Saprospiraceae bacterium]
MDQKTRLRKGANTYLKYSGMAFQLIGVIVFGYLIGNYLDDTFRPGKTKYWTAGLILLFLMAYLYKIIKDLGTDK